MIFGAELKTEQLLAMPWLSEGAMIIDQFQITLAKCWALGENVKNEQPNNFKNKQPNNFKNEQPNNFKNKQLNDFKNEQPNNFQKRAAQ